MKKITITLFFIMLLSRIQAQHEVFFEVIPGVNYSRLIDNPSDNFHPITKQYVAEVRDNLGDFEVWENLHVSISGKSLKYNIDKSKRTVTLFFQTDVEGYHEYQIFGKFLHNDGHIYTVHGSGQLYVGTTIKLDLYASIDEVNKTANVYFQNQ